MALETQDFTKLTQILWSKLSTEDYAMVFTDLCEAGLVPDEISDPAEPAAAPGPALDAARFRERYPDAARIRQLGAPPAVRAKARLKAGEEAGFYSRYPDAKKIGFA